MYIYIPYHIIRRYLSSSILIEFDTSDLNRNNHKYKIFIDCRVFYIPYMIDDSDPDFNNLWKKVFSIQDYINNIILDSKYSNKGKLILLDSCKIERKENMYNGYAPYIYDEKAITSKY